MIPKIIHQTAKTAQLAPQWAELQAKVRALHPDCEYRLWTDADNRAFVRSEMPWLLKTFDDMPRPIMRADLIRYVIMFSIGGLYLDIDYEMLKPFDLWEKGCVLPYNRNRSAGDRFDGIGNCIFASAPGNPLWIGLVKAIQARAPFSEDVDVEAETGPEFINRFRMSVGETEWASWRIFMPERALFHPKTPRTEAERQRIVSKGIAYGIHHCHGTWRDTPLWKRAACRFIALLRRQ